MLSPLIIAAALAAKPLPPVEPLTDAEAFAIGEVMPEPYRSQWLGLIERTPENESHRVVRFRRFGRLFGQANPRAHRCRLR